MNIGVNVRQKRMRLGLNQNQIALELGLDRSTIAKWESGESMPRSDKLPELARILKCNVSDLFERETDQENGR